MPKGEIVGIKLVLPLVTTLSKYHRLYRVMQCLPGYAVSTGFCSVHRVQFRIQCSPSSVPNAVFTESPFRMQWLPRNSVNRVNFLHRVSSGYRVQNYSRRLVWTVSSLLPSAWRCRVTQWTPSIRRSPSQFIESELITIGPTLSRILTCVVGLPCLDFIIWKTYI